MSEAYAATGDKHFAAFKAGVSQSSNAVGKALQRPAVQAEVAQQQQIRLFNEVLPMAVAVHLRLLGDPKTPPGALVQAVKLAYDRTLGSEDATKQKEPHEMTPEELATAIATLQRVKSERATTVIDAEPIDEEPSGADIFG